MYDIFLFNYILYFMLYFIVYEKRKELIFKT